MKIPSLIVVILLVASLNTQISGFPWRTNPSSLIHESVEVDLLDDSPHHAGHRHARSAQAYDVMPSQLHFRLRFGDRDVSLRLARNTVGGAPSHASKRGLADFPVFVIEDGQIRRKQLQRDDNVDLYSNETTGSSFVVRKSSNRTQFILEGIFYDGLDQLQLTRDPRGGLHRIHKQTREVDFQDDYINTIINEGVTPSTGGSTRPPPIYKSHARAKRQLDTGGEHEIRLFMVADYKDYKTWLKYYNNNSTLTEVEMNLYYAFVANSISVRYSSVHAVDPSFSLDVVVTGLLIVNSKPVSSWTEENTLKAGSSYVDASKALDAFGQWVKTKNVELPLSDHWMLFTGFDIYINRNPHVAGLAKLGGMCGLSSISIIEQDNTGSVGATAAHELGHSLGSLHDGEEKDCLDEDNFIMSKKLKTPDDDKSASRPWQFSVCSVRAFKRFVSNVDCTRKSSRGHSMLSTSLSPGQVFTADKQCQLALGNGSYFGRRLQYQEGYSSMCRRMFCSVPQVPGLYQSIFTMEKTSCGDKKWCQRGKCEAHVDAPSMEDNCPQGDDPTAPCVQEDCRYYTAHTKTVYCCHTCRGTRPIWEDLVGSFAGEGGVLRRIEESPSASKPALAQTLPSKHVTTTRDDVANVTTTGPSIAEALAPSAVEPSSPATLDPSQPSRASTTVVPQSAVTGAGAAAPEAVGVPKDGTTEGTREVDHGTNNVTTTSSKPLSRNGVPPATSQDVTTTNLTLTLNRLDGLGQVTLPSAFQTDSKASPQQRHSLPGLSAAASSSSSSSGATLLDSDSGRGSSSLTNLTIPLNIGNAEKLNPDQNFVILQNSTAPVRFAGRHPGLNMVTDLNAQPDTGDQSRGEDVSLNIVAGLKDRARSLGLALDNKSSPGERGVVVSLPIHELEVLLRSSERFDLPLIPQSGDIIPAVGDKSILPAVNPSQNESKTSPIHSNLGPNLNGTFSQVAARNENGKPTESTSDRLQVNTSKITGDMTLPPTTTSTSTSSQSDNSLSTTRTINPSPDTWQSDPANIATYPGHVEHVSRAIPAVSDIDIFLDPIIPFTPSQLPNRNHGVVDILQNRREINTISYDLQVPTVASPSEIPNFYQDDFPVASSYGLAEATPKTDSDSRAILSSGLHPGELLPRTNSEAQANRWRSTGNAPAVFGNSRPYNFDTADTVDYVVDYLVPREDTSTLPRTPSQKDGNKEYLYAVSDQQTVSDKQQQQLQNALRTLMTNRIHRINPHSETVSRPTTSVPYQGDLNRFLEELSSSQTSTSLPIAPTTAEADNPTVFPKCRFQCVFYREPSNGPPILLDEMGRYLMSSFRRSASNPIVDSTVLSHLFKHAAFQTNVTNLMQTSGYLQDSLLPKAITMQDTQTPKVTTLRDSILPKVNKLQDSLFPQTTTLQDSLWPKGTTLQDSLLPKSTIVQDSLFQKAATWQEPILPKVSTFQNTFLPKFTSLPDYPLQKTASLQETIGSKVTTISQNTDSEKQVHV